MAEENSVNQNSIKAQLLEKIRITLSFIQEKIPDSKSDLEVFYTLNRQQMLLQLQAILNADKTELEQKKELKVVLADYWREIQDSPFAYCQNPRDPVNQLCMAIALYIEPLPANIADTDAWTEGQGPYFILMPGLEACKDTVAETNIHQLSLHEFILSEDKKRYIPVVDTLNYFVEGSNQQPIHLVFTDSQMADSSIDKSKNPLSKTEIESLSNHSEITCQLMQKIAILQDPLGSFFNRIQKFADGLMAGSAHGGSGQSDNTAEPGNLAIVEFFEYWDGLPAELRSLYLSRAPGLEPILKRIKDPVSILKQGVNYCTGLTGGALRNLIRANEKALRDDEKNQLKAAVQKAIRELEQAIKEPSYSLKPSNKALKPQMHWLMQLPLLEQQRLIKDHLKMDYPNFLLYALDQQPNFIKDFVGAWQNSKHQQAMLQQRAANGMSILMIIAMSYPQELDRFLNQAISIGSALLLDELDSANKTGDTFPFLVLQNRPDLLGNLFDLLRALPEKSQVALLTHAAPGEISFAIATLENNPLAFIDLCKIANNYTKENLYKLLSLSNLQGENLVNLALRHCPESSPEVLHLLGKLDNLQRTQLLMKSSPSSPDLLLLLLDKEPVIFKSYLALFNNLDTETLFTSISKVPDAWFHKLAYCPTENLLALLTSVSSNHLEQLFNRKDGKQNHLLLQLMLSQKTIPAKLWTHLASLSKDFLYQLLNHKNQDGFSVLSLAIYSKPDFFPAIRELLNQLEPKKQQQIWQQTTIHGWHLPILAVLYSAEHFAISFENANTKDRLSSLQEKDQAGNSLMGLIALKRSEDFPLIYKAIQEQPPEKRFALLIGKNHHGDSLFNWILQQPAVKPKDVFTLLEGFTEEQILKLILEKNEQGQHMLSIAYRQGNSAFNLLTQNLANNGLKKIPAAYWFDLLLIAVGNGKDFLSLYNQYKKIHDNHSEDLADLFQCETTAGNNLLMLVLTENPTLFESMMQEVKALDAHTKKTQIFLHTNTKGQSLLELVHQFAPDNIRVNMESYINRLDKNASREALTRLSLKMQNSDVLLPREELDNYNESQLLEKLHQIDEQGNSLLGQIIQRMPLFLPALLNRMKQLLKPAQIQQLLNHRNQAGLPIYCLAMQQRQAAYLCTTLQDLIPVDVSVEQICELLEQESTSFLAFSLEQGKSLFIRNCLWINTLNPLIGRKLFENFWNQASQPFTIALETKDPIICQMLLHSSFSFPQEQRLVWMKNQANALCAGLSSENPAVKTIIVQFWLSLPAQNRWELLKDLSAERILEAINDESLSIIDGLSIEQQLKLYAKRDVDGNSVIMAVLQKKTWLSQPLLNRLSLFSPAQQASLMEAAAGKTSLLHILANSYPNYFSAFLTCMETVASGKQLGLWMQLDEQGRSALDCVKNRPQIYEKLSKHYLSLCQNDLIQLMTQKSGNPAQSLLLTFPDSVKQTFFARFKSFPQSAQIQILQSLEKPGQNGIKSLMIQAPWLQLELLPIIGNFPRTVIGNLCQTQDGAENLLFWLLQSKNHPLEEQALALLPKLANPKIKAIFSQQRPEDGCNLLQYFATQYPNKFQPLFQQFLLLPTNMKVEILLQKNIAGQDLLSLLVLQTRFDDFDCLCKTIAFLPMNEKLQIVNNSNLIPTEMISRWRSVLAGSTKNERFIDLLNNKAFYPSLLPLIQSLPASVQITILHNRIGLKTVLQSIDEPKKTQLKRVLNQAKALAEAERLLVKMENLIPAEAIHSPLALLHQSLQSKLVKYQNTYQKGIGDADTLARGFAAEIQDKWPQLEHKLNLKNILLGLLKALACFLIPAYGAYQLYQKMSSNRNVLFRTDLQKSIYRLEDLAGKIASSVKTQQRETFLLTAS